MIRQRLQRLLRLDLAYFLHGGIRLGIGQIVTTALSFFLSIVLVNALPQETYGQYKYALSILVLVAIPTLTEMATAVTRSVSRGFEGSVAVGMKTKLRWGMLGTLGGLGVAFFYFVKGDLVLASSIAVGSIAVPITETLLLYDAYFQGKKQFGRSARAFIATQIAYTFLLTTTVYLTKQLSLIFCAGYLALIIVRGFYAYKILRSAISDGSSDSGMLKFGTHLSFMKMMGLVSGSVWSIALFHFVGSEHLAMYAVAIAPVEQLRGFLVIGESLLLPKISDPLWKLGDAKAFLHKLLPILGGVGIILVIYFFTVPFFYALFFPKYISVVPYSILYSTSLLFTSVQIVTTAILKSREALRELHILNVVDMILSFILAIPMMYLFQITGLLIAIIVIKIILGGTGIYLLFARKPLRR